MCACKYLYKYAYLLYMCICICKHILFYIFNKGFIMHIACFYRFDILQFKLICGHLIKIRYKTFFPFIFFFKEHWFLNAGHLLSYCAWNVKFSDKVFLYRFEEFSPILQRVSHCQQLLMSLGADGLWARIVEWDILHLSPKTAQLLLERFRNDNWYLRRCKPEWK